jgi:hypothetical protein
MMERMHGLVTSDIKLVNAGLGVQKDNVQVNLLPSVVLTSLELAGQWKIQLPVELTILDEDNNPKDTREIILTSEFRWYHYIGIYSLCQFINTILIDGASSEQEYTHSL